MFNDDGLLERGDVVRVAGRGATTLEHALGQLHLPPSAGSPDRTPRQPPPHVGDGVLPPPSGFRNQVPRPRDVRDAMGEGTKRCDRKDRDALEKERLANRRGGHHNYQPPKQATFPEPGSLGYADSYDRFQGDFAAHEFTRRQHEIEHKKEVLQTKADKSYAREAQRWEGIEGNYEGALAAQADKLAQAAPHRNKASVPYNLVSLKPDESYEAQMITYTEELTLERAARRANKLYSSSVSQEYNLITNEPVAIHSMMPVPAKPAHPVKPPTPQLKSQVRRVDRAFGDAMDAPGGGFVH